MVFWKSGAAAALLMASVSPGLAQSPPPPMMAPPPMMMGTVNWSGFYLGFNLGGGQASDKVSNPALHTTSPSFDFGGPVGGGTAGFNWQLSNAWLLGIEGDMDASGLSGSTGCPSTTYICGARNPWLGTARARIGYAPGAGNMLWFVTGGAAFGEVDRSVVGPIGSKNGGDRVGWTAGGGGEYMFAPAWSVKVEYRHVDLSSNFDANLGLLGFNFHFNAPPPPPAPMAMPAPPPAAPKVFIVFFDWDKDTITPEGQQIIQQAADAYKAGAPVQIQVTGYTDRSGSAGYNQRLSERRANNVAKAMAALGVPKEQMMVSGRGENDNRVPTADGVREPQNRRVEIVSP
jgi:opacity protein-like surface antigen